MDFIEVPNEISINDIIDNGFSFSPLQYKGVQIKNKNKYLLKDLLDRKLTFKEKGFEVGSQSYITNSSKFFIRNKALQPESFFPIFVTDSCVPILPGIFRNYNLKEGDILISKDSNIGEVVILDQDYPNHMFSGGMYKLTITNNKYYVFAFLKSNFFKNQLELKTPKGATIKHAKTLFLDCYIPFPNQKNNNEVINYVEMLVESVINKEKKIKEKDNIIYNLINNELNLNQKESVFKYEYPDLVEITSFDRIDAAIYSEVFKRLNHKIKNYKYGYKNIYEMNFEISRGQNLQKSCIGDSIISNINFKKAYRLLFPKNISYYGTINEYQYIANPKIKKLLKRGDLIFGAEGFEKGRSYVFLHDSMNAITNIHGITLHHKKDDIELSIFVKCFLDYLRKNSIIDIFSVGVNGGSLAQKYWHYIYFPNIPKEKRNKISKEYYNNILENDKYDVNLFNFKKIDEKINKQAGIIQLGWQIELIRKKLENVIMQIANDEIVNIDFSFLQK